MVSFLIVTYFRSDLVARFFARMAEQSLPHEFVVVDNDSDISTRNTLKSIVGLRKNINVHYNTVNIGFGPACNMATEHAGGNVFVFTQPDVILLEDVAAKVRDTVIDGVLYGHQLHTGDTGWNKFGNEVFPYLNGHFLACTRNTWNAIGGFDPRYWPIDYEDVDLSVTASRAGILLRTIDVKIQHDTGAHWRHGSREATTQANKILFAEKWNLNGPD